MQGITAYVDSRGFAGSLHQSGDVFEWHRDVDLEPPGPYPDAGAMVWDGNTLVETGVHADYVEHWVRDDATTTPCWGLFLHSADLGSGLLLRVGDSFGWAGAGSVFVAPVDGSRWKALAIELSGDRLRADGTLWTVQRREGNVNS